ncbi:hypothetical protein ACRYCC_39225 [Actinomadura scrupuli]|uniref:hypothetical protein n=1 Tax=Actinomadura scrupuli TaxID=559629 RepID=UPI003D9733E8
MVRWPQGAGRFLPVVVAAGWWGYLVLSADSPQIAAFYAGTGGMGVLFYRWRMKQDRLAQVLCLIAFGTWGVAVGVASVFPPKSLTSDEPATWVAGAALLTGLIGAIVVLVHAFLTRGRNDQDDGDSARPVLPRPPHG